MFRLVFCSCPRQEARGLARGLIEQRLAACVQIVQEIDSVYRWEGKICEDQEALLLCKTTADRVADLTKFIKEKHSYTVPEVVSVPLQDEEGNPDYLSWLRAQVAENEEPNAPMSRAEK